MRAKRVAAHTSTSTSASRARVGAQTTGTARETLCVGQTTARTTQLDGAARVGEDGVSTVNIYIARCSLLQLLLAMGRMTAAMRSTLAGRLRATVIGTRSALMDCSVEQTTAKALTSNQLLTAVNLFQVMNGAAYTYNSWPFNYTTAASLN